MLLVLRAVLAAENRKRERERAARGGHDDAKYDDMYIVRADADGKAVEHRVDKVCATRAHDVTTGR